MSNGIKRTGSTHRSLRAVFSARIDGAQNPDADTYIPITDSKSVYYTSASPSTTLDSGLKISKFYRKFAIQADKTVNSRDITVEVSVDGSTWFTIPSSMHVDTSGVNNGVIAANTGNAIFVTLPMHGILVRLKVAQPLAATDFTVRVIMTDSLERYDLARS